MKKNILVLCVVLTALFASAQPDKYAKALMNTPFIAFEEQQINFKDAVHPSVSILVTADEGAYVKDFKSWLKSKYMIEPKKNSGFYSASGVLISEWAADSLNFHYKTDKDGDAVRLNILLEKKGEFFDEKNHADEISKLKASLTLQVKEFYVKYYDEKIADQQKFYEAQVSDMEKLVKKKGKLNDDITGHNNGISKTEESIRETNSKTSTSESQIKSLNAQLQQDQKAAEQAKKEVDAQSKLINEKEVEYNRLNASGSLNSKEGERVIKDLEKFRGKQEKLQSTLTKANEKTTKTENAILKEEQNKTKQMSKLDDLKTTKDNHERDISDLKRDLQNNESAVKDEQQQIDSARTDLDKLKAAKLKLIGGAE